MSKKVKLIWKGNDERYLGFKYLSPGDIFEVEPSEVAGILSTTGFEIYKEIKNEVIKKGEKR